MRYFFILWLLVCTAHVQADDPSRALSEQHLTKLRTDIDELQDYLKKVQDDHKEMVASLRRSDQEVAKVSQLVEKLRASLKEERARLKKLQVEQRSLDKKQSQQQTTLKEIILATYKMGQEPQLKLLLNQQDASKVARNIHLLTYFSDAHQKQISAYRTTLKKVNSIRQEVIQRKETLQENFKAIKSTHKKLKEKQSAQKKNTLALNKKIHSSDEKLKRLQQDRQQLIELLGRVEDVFLKYERSQESRPFTSLKKQLPSPTGLSPKKLFGMWQDNGKQKWQGWLYPGRAGSPIKAIHHGRVVFSDWLRGFGLLTILDHGQGYMSLYARNQSLFKTVGDWVESGEIISQLGRSGGYQQDALYFEIRHKGQPQSPVRWLKK